MFKDQKAPLFFELSCECTMSCVLFMILVFSLSSSDLSVVRCWGIGYGCSGACVHMCADYVPGDVSLRKR